MIPESLLSCMELHCAQGWRSRISQTGAWWGCQQGVHGKEEVNLG